MRFFEKRILITVKTYPTISQKYDETVCTAGITADGEWIRLYPVPFRRLEDVRQYKKYQWIKARIARNTPDFRPESHTLDINSLELQKEVGVENNWQARKDIVARADLYEDLDRLISDARGDKCTSLAVFKPHEIVGFKIESDTEEWAVEKLQAIEARKRQRSLFKDDTNELSRIVNKLPFKFSYTFRDIKGNESTLMIADWELGALYFNCLKAGSRKLACEKVREKYLGFKRTKDLCFFLGTSKAFHHVGPNPFIIIGIFYPPKTRQQTLPL